MELSEPSIDDLKKRLEIRAVIIGKQSDRIQKLVQKIHMLEKDLAGFQALATEKEFRIYQKGEDQVSPERLLAEKQEIEKLLEQKNQEILLLTAKLDGLSATTPEGSGNLETLTLENLRLQEQLREVEQKLERQQSTTESPKDLQDAENLIEKLWGQLEEERERQTILEKRTQDYEQLMTERNELRELLKKKTEEITALGTRLQERNSPGRGWRRKKVTTTQQDSRFQEELERIKKQLEIEQQKFLKENEQLKNERQKLLKERNQLKNTLDEKVKEIIRLRGELERQQTEQDVRNGSLEGLAAENNSLRLRLQEAEREIQTLQTRLAEETEKEKVVPFVETIPVRNAAKRLVPAPPVELSSIKEVAPPSGWERLDLPQVFESFIDFLTQGPTTKDIITSLEELRDILFERRGGGMAVRKCGEEIQKIKRGAGSAESLIRTLREIATILEVRLDM